MGTDKAFVRVDGREMVLRVADALRTAGCSPIECQGGDTVRLSALGLTVVDDGRPGSGPAAAVQDAIGRHACPVVVVACDLPAVTPAAIDAVVGAVRNGAGAAVAEADGARHLLACFDPSAPEVVSATRRPVDGSFGHLLDLVAAVRIGVDGAAMHNVNRPSDVAVPDPGEGKPGSLDIGG